MTPAIKILQKAKAPFTIHEYAHSPEADSFGDETVAALGVDAARVFKTLVAQTDAGELVMGIVPVSGRLSPKALAAALGAKKADMADPHAAERATGYVVGGISPLGGRKALRVVIDSTALQQTTIFISAGRRGMQIEIAPQELIKLMRATTGEIVAKA